MEALLLNAVCSSRQHCLLHTIQKVLLPSFFKTVLEIYFCDCENLACPTLSACFSQHYNKLDICMCCMLILGAALFWLPYACFAMPCLLHQSGPICIHALLKRCYWCVQYLFTYELLNHFWHRFPLENFILHFLAIPRFLRSFVYKRKLCTETDFFSLCSCLSSAML